VLAALPKSVKEIASAALLRIQGIQDCYP